MYNFVMGQLTIPKPLLMLRRVDLDENNLTDILVAGDGIGQMIDLEIYNPNSSGTSETATHYILFQSKIPLLLLLVLSGLWLTKAQKT